MIEGLVENFLTEGLTLKKAFYIAESRTSRWTPCSGSREARDTADILSEVCLKSVGPRGSVENFLTEGLTFKKAF